jgi:threonyl-tRNA synthetase
VGGLASRQISYGLSSSITGCPTPPPTRGSSSWNSIFRHGSGAVGQYVSSSTSMRLRSTITEPSTEESVPVNKNDNNDIHESSSSMTTTEEIVELPTNEDNDNELLKLRHSTAHVMAMAVQRIYPEAQTTIGPWIENGFYYDFYFPPETVTTDNDGEEPPPSSSRKLNESDLKSIKKEMDKIISANYPILRKEVSREEARALIMEKDEPFKLELLDSIIGEDNITIYSIGEEWWDLCAGPHIESTGQLNKKATVLESVAGSYWRGDENKQSLQRIYGTAWKDMSQLKAYKSRMEEAKKRDHRVLGKKLDLFSIQVRSIYIYIHLM